MKFSSLFSCLTVGLMLASPCRAEIESTPISPVRTIIEHLDVTSFESSIGPRRETNKVTFKDYGVTTVSYLSDTEAALRDKEADWSFHLKVLENDGNDMLICLTDKAENGGSYNTRQALKLTQKVDGSIEASRDPVTDPRCPAYTR